jgi:23S rRNA (adenine2030-N6)-methyltransferase
MNYRHAYHAGNFADCMKHALLVALLRALQNKPKPLLVLDTHAGIGMYDLASDEATRTGEWRTGIAPLLAARPPALADYLSFIDRLGLYPGSPALAAALLRPDDRLIACELHPQDAATLRGHFAGTPQVAVHRRDGYEALRAFLPPPERRALILIDPPYEATDEFGALAQALIAAHGKFPSGLYCAWYPIKHRAPVRAFFETLTSAGLRDIVAAELLRRPPLDPSQLNGCGLAIINPPYGFAAVATPILNTLCALLGEAGASAGVTVIADE